ncbi:hypothetical protein BCIN_02g08080 [Botrytis cinerea B05.10]|uniref:Uncharacterized protein n=3 Tax=Botryotinia fuckeliana TaxID=40559 RepID=A0A384JAT8_BOTFB|nr:hypothetical protein BCIN_02g08080 [Botrytis cinerea B05.10]ATZ47537.1 hypothetical protein BCIN_02g08080 [Botrytis cinerea B05.10]EMR82212.1 hypothetical protein BcDW1_9115 [Botrytis cinerea BcDW1]CCD43308.1 hypothetical protein BofuT4_P067160.1 [Botrytis cinerea T4]
MDDYGVGSSGNTGTPESQAGAQGSYDSSGSYGSSGSQTAQGQYNAQTTAYQSAYTSAATPTTTSNSQSQTNSAFPTSTSSSNGLSSSERTAIIAGVLGGVGALLIISLIAIYLLQRRKTKKVAGRKGVTQQVSYNGLNSSFAGVPFIKSHTQGTDGEISRPPMVADTSYQGAYMRGGQSSYPDLSSDMETDRFLPNDEETQQRMAAGGNGYHSPSNHLGSPTQDPFTDQNRLSQLTQNRISQLTQNRLSQLSQNPESPTRPGPLVRHDTMGFPLDDDDTSYIGPDGEQHRLSRIMHSPHASILEPTIIAPAPVRPTISHENLERGLNGNQDLYQNRAAPQHLDSLTSNYDNPYDIEDENDTVPPMYGAVQTSSPAPMESGSWIAARNPHLAAAFGNDMHRNSSTRTQSSFAPSVVSDTELDRLGVGQRP